jgi:hypothetical protein
MPGGVPDAHRSNTRCTPPQGAPLPSADAQQYLKGAVWTMQMYIAGRCPDYRYTYAGASPSAPEILQVLRRRRCAAARPCSILGGALWSVEQALLRAASACLSSTQRPSSSPSSRQVLQQQPLIGLATFPDRTPPSPEPLLPHACAMALLPAASAALAPSGLRHLMQVRAWAAACAKPCHWLARASSPGLVLRKGTSWTHS